MTSPPGISPCCLRPFLIFPSLIYFLVRLLIERLSFMLNADLLQVIAMGMRYLGADGAATET